MAKKGDFITIDYTGKLEDGSIFDTTEPAVAKKEGLQGEKFHAVTICVGENMLLKGLDAAIDGKTEKEFSVTLQPEEAFGKKDPSLLQIIPTNQLLQQNIKPQVGLQLNIDGNYGVVKRTGGGRTTVDFNHPLASQVVTYDVKIRETVTDSVKQIKALFDIAGLPYLKVTAEGDKATVTFPQLLPQPILDQLQKKITTLTTIKTVSFEQGEAPKNK